MFSDNSSAGSQSEVDSSDEEVFHKKSTTVQANYPGYLNDKPFLTALGRGPRSSMGSLNSFIEGLEDLPENLQLEGGAAWKKWSRDLNDQCRNLEEMVTYSARKDCLKKIQKIADCFEFLKKTTLPSRRKGATVAEYGIRAVMTLKTRFSASFRHGTFTQTIFKCF